MLVRRCSWCGWLLGLKRGGWGVTDGMCSGCYERIEWEVNGTPAEPRSWLRGIAEVLAALAAFVVLLLAAGALQ